MQHSSRGGVELDNPKVILASPGDVSRMRAKVASLFRGQGSRKIGVYTWETEVDEGCFDFDLPAQVQIPLTSDKNCRGLICLLGERIGTAIPRAAFTEDVIAYAQSKQQGKYYLEPDWRPGVEDDGAFSLTGTVFELLSALKLSEERFAETGERFPIFVGVIGDSTVIDRNKEPWDKNFGFRRHLAQIGAMPGSPAANIYASQTTQLSNFVNFISEVNNVPPHVVDEDTGIAKIRDWLAKHVFQSGTAIRFDSPYKGLQRYETSDADLYFGRDDAGEEARETLSEISGDRASIIFVKGGSGFGKSSFLRASMLGPLAKDLDTNSWGHAVIRPNELESGTTSGERLGLLLSAIFRSPDSGLMMEETEVEDVVGHLDALKSENRVQHAVQAVEKRLGEEGRLVLAIDQFEELFDVLEEARSDPDALTATCWLEVIEFLNEISQLKQCVVVMTLQSNRVPLVETHPVVQGLYENAAKIDLAELPNIREVIRKPMQMQGALEFCKDLADAVEHEFLDFKAKEKSAETGAYLPLLSMMLDELWVRRIEPWLRHHMPEIDAARSGDGSLTTTKKDAAAPDPISPVLDDKYRITGIVARKADEALQVARKRAGPLWGDNDNVVRSMLRPLVRTSLDRADRIVLMRSKLSPGSAGEILADEMRERRLMERAPDGTYRLIHESVVQSWPIAREFLDREKFFHDHERHVTGLASGWRECDTEPDREKYAALRHFEIGRAMPLLSEWWELFDLLEANGSESERLVVRDFSLALLPHAETPSEQFIVEPRSSGNQDEEPKKSTPVHIAAFYQKEEICRDFLERDPSCRFVLGSQGRTLLASPSWNGDLELLKLLHAGQIDLDVADKDGWRCVHFATLNGHREVLDFLFDQGADHCKGTSPWTLLRTTAVKDDDTTAGYLLDRFPDLIEDEGDGGAMLINLLAELGKPRLARFLLGKESLLNLSGEAIDTALRTAIIHGHSDIAEILIEAGANPDSTDESGWSSLHFSAAFGCAELLRSLAKSSEHLSKGAKRYSQSREVSRHLPADKTPVTGKAAEGWTPLHLAVAYSHAECVKALVEAGADVGALNGEDNTPLCHALQNFNDDLDIQLIEPFLQTNAANIRNSGGRLPLYVALDEGHLEAAALLAEVTDLEAPASSKLSNDPGQTILQEMAGSGNVEAVRLLLEKGADTRHAPASRLSALHVAAARRQHKICELLLEYDPEMIRMRNRLDRTPAMVAALAGDGELVKLLAPQRDLDLLSGESGVSALHLAARSGNEAAVGTALELGVPNDIADANGWTPLHIAAQFGFPEIAKILLARGADAMKRAAKPPLSPREAATELGLETIVALLDEHASAGARSEGRK